MGQLPTQCTRREYGWEQPNFSNSSNTMADANNSANANGSDKRGGGGGQRSDSSDPIDTHAVRAEDLEEIDAMLAAVGFEVGSHILRLYYENSDHRWRLATNVRGEIVAFASSHILPLNGIEFGFFMYVKEEYQNRGIIRRISTMYSSGPRLGNASEQAMARFPQHEKYDAKFQSYQGRPQLHLLRSRGETAATSALTIRTVRTEDDMRKVVAYDREFVYRSDRERFMRAWCGESTKSSTHEPYVKTLMAETKDGRVVGYCVLRWCTDYYSLQPLYADDSATAERLLAAVVRTLVEECGRDAELFVYFEASNHCMMRFVSEQKFEHFSCEIRYYAKGASVIKDYCSFDRAYSYFDYWPI